MDCWAYECAAMVKVNTKIATLLSTIDFGCERMLKDKGFMLDFIVDAVFCFLI
jgi:hypothetical protein